MLDGELPDWVPAHNRVAKLTAGQRVLIHGAAGGTGSAMVELGKLMDLEVYGTASKPKHDLVSSLGATPIDYRNEDFVERVHSLTGGGVHLVVDHIGGAHLKRSFQTLWAGGLLLSAATISGFTGQSSTLEVMLSLLQWPLWNILPNGKSAVLFGLVGLDKKNPTWLAEDLNVLMGYLAESKIKPVIARRMPLAEAREAQELIAGAKVKGKITLVCSEP